MGTVVLYHGNCPDGWTAAWLLATKLGLSEDQLIPCTYGAEPPDVTGDDVFVVDFSFETETAQRLVDQSSRFVMLDHHQTAFDKMESVTGLDVLTVEDLDQMAATGIDNAKFVVLDNALSGAGLTARYLYGSTTSSDVPWPVKYIQDRDLWAWALPETDTVTMTMDTLPFTLEAWNTFTASHTPTSAKAIGEFLIAYRERIVASMIKQSRKVVIGGVEIEVAPSTMELGSYVGAVLADRVPDSFAGYYVFRDGKYRFGLRSAKGTGADVATIAAGYGGGGHYHASGFVTVDPFSYIL